MSKVSVVVPCYKVEKYLPELIESLQCQTLRDIEVILVDDGSPDRTGRICDEYAAEDERLHVIHKPNGGVSAARNDGMKSAVGEYIIFVDSDDYLPKNALELLYTKAEQTGADIVMGDVTRIASENEERGRMFSEEFVIDNKDYIKRLIKTVFYRTYCPNSYQGKPAFGYSGPCNKLIRRKLLIENYILFDIRVKGIYDDYIYCAYALASANKVAYIDQNVYNYRILDTSITNTYKKDMLEINQAIFSVWGEFLEKYNQDGAYTSAYYANVLKRFDESLKKYFFSKDNPQSRSERKKDLRDTIRSEPYCNITRYAEPKKLDRRHLVEYKLLKFRSASLICLFYDALDLYRKIRR